MHNDSVNLTRTEYVHDLAPEQHTYKTRNTERCPLKST